MIYVGIDAAKRKHDCCILDPQGKPYPVFSFSNSHDGFQSFFQKLFSICSDKGQIKIGLEATGPYSENLFNALVDRSLPVLRINPLLVKNFKSSMSLRRTKTDKVDAQAIAQMVKEKGDSLQTYSTSLYHMEELKSLTRYRLKLVGEQSKLRVSVSRLVTILFPELESLVSSLHLASIQALLIEWPGHQQLADCNLKRLTNLLKKHSRGQFGKPKAIAIQQAARQSIGRVSPSKSLELRQTLKKVAYVQQDLDEVEAQIKDMVDSLHSPILDIPGIGYTTGAMILAEVGDFNRFANADKLLAFSGMSPSKYESGEFKGTTGKMEKRGSSYLRYALYTAAKLVSQFAPQFKSYYQKKRAEQKPYNVALSHVAKKLTRVLYKLGTTGEAYRPQAA